MADSILRVLDADPELAEGLEGARVERARAEALARVRRLPAGERGEVEWPEPPGGFGLLLVEGLLVRHVSVAGREGAELLTGGDLLRPWEKEDENGSMLLSSAWRVLEPTTVAVLDVRFALRVRSYPEIASQLMARMLRRARSFAVIMAIVHQPRVDRRVLMLLWHLADRAGRVRPDGILVPMRLTHAIVAELVAARRPTVSAAVSSLEREGQLSHTRSGWLLTGRPPAELVETPAP